MHWATTFEPFVQLALSAEVSRLAAITSVATTPQQIRS